MSFINYASREINCKLVYYGPGLCGKTTNLQYIYERSSPDSKGKMISLATESERTLFFDFLPLSLGEIRGFKTRFHLYTVPGQVFYDASRKLILKGVDGVVFVADSQVGRLEANLESLENLRINLAEQGYDLDTLPYVMQYNKRDLPEVSTVAELHTLLNPTGVPELEAVARTGVGVFDTLKSLARLLIAELKKTGLASRILVSMTLPPGSFPPGSIHVAVTAGRGAPVAIAFSRGLRQEPISIGLAGAWRMEAPGLADIHAFLYFDGNLLFAASANMAYPALVNGYPVPGGWTQLIAPCEIALGALRLAVYDPSGTPTAAGYYAEPSLLTPAPFVLAPTTLRPSGMPPATQHGYPGPAMINTPRLPVTRTSSSYPPSSPGYGGTPLPATLGSVVITDQPLQVPAGPPTLPRGMAAPPPALRAAFLDMLEQPEKPVRQKTTSTFPPTSANVVASPSIFARLRDDWNHTPPSRKLLAALIPVTVIIAAVAINALRASPVKSKPAKPAPSMSVAPSKPSSSAFLVLSAPPPALVAAPPPVLLDRAASSAAETPAPAASSALRPVQSAGKPKRRRLSCSLPGLRKLGGSWANPSLDFLTFPLYGYGQTQFSCGRELCVIKADELGKGLLLMKSKRCPQMRQIERPWCCDQRHDVRTTQLERQATQRKLAEGTLKTIQRDGKLRLR